jgi:hypothetical protein
VALQQRAYYVGKKEGHNSKCSGKLDAGMFKVTANVLGQINQ